MPAKKLSVKQRIAFEKEWAETMPTRLTMWLSQEAKVSSIMFSLYRALTLPLHLKQVHHPLQKTVNMLLDTFIPLSYIENTSSVSQLKYVFNKEKTTLAEANMIMVKFIGKNKTDVWNKMSAEDKAELGVEDYEDFTSEKTKQFVSMFVEVH